MTIVNPDKVHPKARQVHDLSQRGFTATLTAKITGLTKQEVRFIKMAMYRPKLYMEWQIMEQKRKAQEAKEKAW